MQPQGAERLAAVAAAVAVVASWSVRAAVRYGSAAVSNLIRRNAVIKQRDRHPSLPTYWRFAALLALMPGLALAQPVPLQGVIAVDAGGGHTCAALSDGGARCWGYNFLAQVGDGSRTDRLLPVRVVDLNDPLAALGLGESHSCALTQGGVVRCWGMNVYGQLGDGTTDLGLRPVTARNLGTGVLQVGGGENNSCALTAQHGVKCWGANYSGQLGDGFQLHDQALLYQQINAPTADDGALVLDVKINLPSVSYALKLQFMAERSFVNGLRVARSQYAMNLDRSPDHFLNQCLDFVVESDHCHGFPSLLRFFVFTTRPLLRFLVFTSRRFRTAC